MRSSKLLAAFSCGAEMRPLRLNTLKSSYRISQTPSLRSAVQNATQSRLYSAFRPASGASQLLRPAYTPIHRQFFGLSAATSQIQRFSGSPKSSNEQPPASQSEKKDSRATVSRPEQNQVEENKEELGFELSERAAQAAHIDLTAKLGRGDGKDSKQKPGVNEIWRLLKIARPEAKSLCLAFFFLLISSGITMSIPFSIGKLMDLATKGEDEEGIFGLSKTMFYGALAGIMCLGAAANYGRIIILRIVGERVVARQRSKLFRRTFVQDAEFFDANRVGDLISRLSSDTLIVGKSITQNLSDGLRAIVSCCAGFGAMAYVSLKLSSVLLILLPPIGVGAFFYGRTIRTLSRNIQKNLGTLTKIAEERLGNVKTSQAFAAEVSEVARYNKQVKNIFELGKKESLISATFFSSTGFMGNMTILVLLYVGGGLVSSGGLTLGELTSFLMYTVYAGSSLFGLSNFYSEIMKGVGAASRLFELQDRQPKISPTRGERVDNARGPIRFENVTFSYPTRPSLKIFSNLDFEIPQGSNVAIVGPSGGGKSTIASLLLRFYNPVEGRILINGKDITEMNAKSLRRKIGIVSQEPVLFSGTIAENIAYGVPGASRSEIVAAAKQANCQFISDFPSGLETNVGPRGAQLSGGQKQRIAIARALIKNPDILVLDEATSALDAESETLVNSALAALLGGNNTTISIAHRLSTIKRSDTIIVLGNQGQVAEIGSYKELSARPEGAFTKLMEWQMTGGEDAPPPINPRNISFEEQMQELEREEREKQAAEEADGVKPTQERGPRGLI